jgi:hypothetical protein
MKEIIAEAAALQRIMAESKKRFDQIIKGLVDDGFTVDDIKRELKA